MEKKKPLLWTMALTALASSNAMAQADPTRQVEIANPGFESNFTGWTNLDGFKIKNKPSTFEGAEGAKVCHKDNTKSPLSDAQISQTIKLPVGVYELSAIGRHYSMDEAMNVVYLDGFYLFAGENAVAFKDGTSRSVLAIEITDPTQELVIGAKLDKAQGNYAQVDDFQLVLSEASLEAAKAELTQKLSIVINKTKVVTEDQFIKDVLVEASELQADINKMDFEAYAAYKNAEEGNFADLIKTLGEKVEKLVANKKQYDRAMDAYSTLANLKEDLDDAYDGKLFKDTYEAVVASYDAYLDDLKDAYGRTNAGAVFTDKVIDERINDLSELLVGTTEAIKNGNQNLADYNAVKAMVTNALAVYTSNSNELYEHLSGEHHDVYADWHAEATVKINKVKRDIQAIADANEIAKDAENDAENASALKGEHERKIQAAVDELNRITSEKVAEANVLKANYATACADVKGLTETLNALFDEDAPKAEFDDVTAIETAIAALQDNVDAANKEHTIKGEEPYCENYKDDRDAIVKLIGELAIVVREYKFNKLTVKAIAALKEEFETAKMTVNELVSKDEAYKVDGMYPETEGAIQKAIDDFTTAADAAFKEGKAEEFNANLNANGASAISAMVTDYQKNAEAALDKYDTLSEAIKVYEDDLAALDKEAVDKGVTIGGDVEGKVTYAQAIASIATEIENIKNALADALALKDTEHYKAVMGFKMVTTNIAQTVAWKDAYKTSAEKWNAEQQKNAKEKILKEANARLEAMSIPAKFSTDEYGKRADELLNPARTKIEEGIAAAQAEVDAAGSKDPAEAIAMLSATVEKITKLEGELAKLDVEAYEVKADYTLEKNARDAKIAEIAKIKALLNGKAETETEEEILSVERLNQDTSKKAHFATKVAELNDLINALESDLNTSIEAETVREDNADSNKVNADGEVEKDEDGNVIIIDGYNTRVSKLLNAVNGLRDKAIKATDNFIAYKEIVEHIGGVKGSKITEAIDKAKADVANAATDAALNFYNGQIDVQKKALGQLCNDINAAYDKGEAVAKMAALKDRADKILDAVNDFAEHAKANEAAKKGLEEEYNKVKLNLAEVRNEVSSSVEIPAEILKVYMAKFSELDATLEETYEAIFNSWSKGTSVNDEPKQTETLNAVQREVKRLSESWTNDYNAEVSAYNDATKAAFDLEHSKLKETYSKAVELIAQMSKTQWAKEFTEELEDVTGEESGVYSYATKIRTLKSKADSTFNATEVGKIFDEEKKFEATAVQYNKEITDKLQTYTKAVNAKAIAKFSAEHAKVNDAYNDAERKIANFDESVKKTAALSRFKEIIDNAEAASNINDFATKLDAILFDFRQIPEKLDQAVENAAKNQYDFVINKVEELYKKEKAAIAKFYNGGAYLTEYEALYKNYVVKARKAYLAIEGDYYYAVTRDVKPLLDVFFKGFDPEYEVGKNEDGSPILESHTEIYIRAFEADKAYHANDVAWDAMLEAAADVQAELDSVKVYAASLLAAHNDDSNESITSRQADLEWIILLINRAHNNGDADEMQETYLSMLETLSDRIADLYKEVIEAEYADVLTAIATLRYDYDRATGADLENAQLDGYKGIIAKYASLNDEYKSKFIDGTLSEDGKTMVYATKEDTHKSYVELETRIGEVRAELAAHYDASLVENTMAELNAALAKVEKDYNTLVAQLEKCHAPVQKLHVETIEAIAAAIEAEKAHVAEDSATILLYADNHKKDIAAIEKIYDGLSVIIADDEIPYVKNDAAYEKLTGQLDALQTALKKVYDESADYKYQSNVIYYGQDENGESIKVTTTYRERWYNLYRQDLASEKNTVDGLYAQIGLNENSHLGTAYDTYVTWFKSYEKNLAKENYQGSRGAFTRLLEDVRDDFNNDKHYTPSDEESLDKVINDLLTKNLYLDLFVNDALNDHVTNDIDGKPINDGVGMGLEYMVAYKAAMTRLAEMNEDLKQLVEDVNSKRYKLGDIDHNGSVDVVDYSYARNIVLGLIEVEAESPKFYAANVKQDEEINIGDVTMIANKIMYDDFNGEGSFAARLKGYTAANNDALALVTEGTGSVQRIAINLKNSVQYVGAQLDIKLPAGVTIVGESLTSRADSHDLMSNEVNGMHRIIVSSIENVAFLNTEDALIYLDVEVSADYAGGAVEVVNAVFADASARTYRLGAASTDTETGITQLGTGEKVIKKIYSVGGQMMNSLRKGVNIIMNSDGTTSKVLKK